VTAAAPKSLHGPTTTKTAVRKRLEAFHRQTLPVATYYKSKSILREVDGDWSRRSGL
jgi:adenylate kinase family enzyme